MFLKKKQTTELKFLFGEKALHHKVIGYLEVANTLRYKGPTIIPFAIMDERLNVVTEFILNPENVDELFAAAIDAKYKPLALLSNYITPDTKPGQYLSFPQYKDGMALSKSVLTPSLRTPTFGFFGRIVACMSQAQSQTMLVFRCKMPSQLAGVASGRNAAEVDCVLMLDNHVTAGPFCVTPASIRRIFDLVKAYSLEPTEFRGFAGEDTHNLKILNRFIASHSNNEINHGMPIYEPAFDINAVFNSRVEQQVPNAAPTPNAVSIDDASNRTRIDTREPMIPSVPAAELIEHVPNHDNVRTLHQPSIPPMRSRREIAAGQRQ